MKWVLVVVVLCAAGCFVYGYTLEATKLLRRGQPWRVAVFFLAVLVTLYAMVGFFAPLLANFGVLNRWGSYEWPVGYAYYVMEARDGTIVVLQSLAARVQIYNSNLHFLRGWPASGQVGFVQTTSGEIEIHEINRLHETVYNLDHQLLWQKDYSSRELLPHLQVPWGQGRWIPTKWWLWPYSSPAYAWLFFIPASILFRLAYGKNDQAR
jgi:hypothetical protein